MTQGDFGLVVSSASGSEVHGNTGQRSSAIAGESVLTFEGICFLHPTELPNKIARKNIVKKEMKYLAIKL